MNWEQLLNTAIMATGFYLAFQTRRKTDSEVAQGFSSALLDIDKIRQKAIKDLKKECAQHERYEAYLLAGIKKIKKQGGKPCAKAFTPVSYEAFIQR